MKQFCIVVILAALSQGEVQFNLKKGPPDACTEGTRPRYISDASGKINSPNYPAPYTGNDQCEWHIESLDNDFIIATFLDMQLQYTTGCVLDSVNVYDGPNDTSPLIASVCENDRNYIPSPVLSSTKDIYVVFRSGVNSGGAEGFEMEFQGDTSCVYGELAPPIYNREGVIASPGHPGQYPNEADCAWTLQAPVDSLVELTIHDVDTEDCCSCDYVAVYNGGSVGNARWAQYYHQDRPSVIVSSRELLTVHFKSDFSNTGTGFNATVRFLPTV